MTIMSSKSYAEKKLFQRRMPSVQNTLGTMDETDAANYAELANLRRRTPRNSELPTRSKPINEPAVTHIREVNVCLGNAVPAVSRRQPSALADVVVISRYTTEARFTTRNCVAALRSVIIRSTSVTCSALPWSFNTLRSRSC